MKKCCLILVLLTFLCVGFIAANAKADSVMIATFADPSPGSSHPLFTADFTALTLDGGWGDPNTGLTLQIPYKAHTYSNAWFDVDNVITLTSVLPGVLYSSGPGKINFYADNSSTPLMVITFNSGYISPLGFGSNEVQFTTQSVTITGSEITDTLSQEQFSFSFANTASLPPGHSGFTATTAFTSSATIVPEPAAIVLLAFGGFALLKKNRRKFSAT